MQVLKIDCKKVFLVFSFVVVLFGCFKRVLGNDKTGILKGEIQPQKRQFHCCARHEKIIKVGHGISGEIISVDIGQCRKLCPLKVYNDPGDSSKPAVQKCSQYKNCHARSAKKERISTIEGIRVIETVDTCECSPGHSCKRKPYNNLLYEGTPFQTNIDVGICMGFCDKDYDCRPVKNSTIIVNGPNGHELYQIIERCGCVSDCYKMDHIETILDYSALEIKGRIKTSDVKPVIRLINVGRCVGSCSKNSTSCIFQNKKNPKNCIAGVYYSHCAPSKFKLGEYRTRRGSKREIIQINECACV